MVRINGKWPLPLFGGDECLLTLKECVGCGCPAPTVVHALLQCVSLAPHRVKLLTGLGFCRVTASNTQEILLTLFGQRLSATEQWSCISFVGLAVVSCMGAGSAGDEPSLEGGIDVDAARLSQLENNINDFLALQVF